MARVLLLAVLFCLSSFGQCYVRLEKCTTTCEKATGFVKELPPCDCPEVEGLLEQLGDLQNELAITRRKLG